MDNSNVEDFEEDEYTSGTKIEVPREEKKLNRRMSKDETSESEVKVLEIQKPQKKSSRESRLPASKLKKSVMN